MKKIIILVAFIIMLTGCSSNKQDTVIPQFVEVKNLLEKEDGWVLTMNASYERIDKENEEVIDNIKKYDDEDKAISLSGANIKYKKLDGFKGKMYDEDGSLIGEIEVDMPSLVYNNEILKEIEAIEEMLKGNFKNNTPLNSDSFNNVKLSYFKEADIIKMFNEILKMKPEKFGNQRMKDHECNQITISDGRTLQSSYIASYGNVKLINIEIISKDIYLSDKVREGKATKEEINLQKEIDALEKQMVDSKEYKADGKLSDKLIESELNKQLVNLLKL
ncbi:MAG: hypothetical protein RR435_02915 [Erysipelotrichaceae bacterium]